MTRFGLNIKKHPVRSFCLLILALVVAGTAVPARAAPMSQAEGREQYTVADCKQLDKQAVRAEIERHALAVLSSGQNPLDVDALVARKWAEVGMDAVLEAEVRRAVDELAANEDYWNRLLSGWWGEKAQEFAERIANDVFGSPAFREKLAELSNAIGADVARQVEAQFARAASVALLCLQAYVGEQYSDTLFDAYQRSVQLETQHLDLAQIEAPIFDGTREHSLALAGVGTILVTQLVYRLGQKLGQKIAQRVAGKVIGRVLGKAGSSFIPVAGWIIGIGMIAYDLWEGGQGALPQIQEGLQSEEVKERIRTEIADAIKDDLPEQSALIALETAVSLVEQWQGFCDAYSYVCMEAASSEAFRILLDQVTLEELDRLNELVDYFMVNTGRAELERLLLDGTLEGLLGLSTEAVAELLSYSEPQQLMAWHALAGPSLPQVVIYGVVREAKPEEFDRRGLATLLNLPDGEHAAKLLALEPERRNALLALPVATLQKLVAVEPAADLDWVASYLLRPGEASPQVIEEVAAGRVQIDDLRARPQTTREAVVEGPSVDTALSPPGEVFAGERGESEMLQSPPESDTIVRLDLWLILAFLAAVLAATAGYAFWRRRTNH